MTKYSSFLRHGDSFLASSAEKAQLLATIFTQAHTNQMAKDTEVVATVNDLIVHIVQTNLTDTH